MEHSLGLSWWNQKWTNNDETWKKKTITLVKKVSLILHFLDNWTNSKNTCLFLPFCMRLIVSAELFKWFSLWSVKGIHPAFFFSMYISEWQGLLTVSESDVCVAWFSVWLLFVIVLFPKMTCNFPAQIIFQKNYILRLCRKRCPFTEM